MDLAEGIADLHMHTTASDGTSTVADRISQATNHGLNAIAITDHDTISDDLTERVSHRNTVEVISGVEVRADALGTKVEILGYYIDPTEETLQNILAKARQFRHKRNEAMIENLIESPGLDLDYSEMRANAEGNVGRPQIAELLVEAGVVDSIGAAFEEYLGINGTAYVPMERVPAQIVIDAIQTAGGLHRSPTLAEYAPTRYQK